MWSVRHGGEDLICKRPYIERGEASQPDRPYYVFTITIYSERDNTTLRVSCARFHNGTNILLSLKKRTKQRNNETTL